MDDLRDYRFYDDDMLHPSSETVNYIWSAFSDSYFENKTYQIWKDVVKIIRATEHHIITDSPSGVKKFAQKILEDIEAVNSKVPSIDLRREKDYFLALLAK